MWMENITTWAKPTTPVVTEKTRSGQSFCYFTSIIEGGKIIVAFRGTPGVESHRPIIKYRTPKR